jgi:hypothetical protein
LGDANFLGRVMRDLQNRRVLQFVFRGIFLAIWNSLIGFFALMSCTKVWHQRKDDESILTSARNLGDVEVQVQVDVNVEKGWTSIAANIL